MKNFSITICIKKEFFLCINNTIVLIFINMSQRNDILKSCIFDNMSKWPNMHNLYSTLFYIKILHSFFFNMEKFFPVWKKNKENLNRFILNNLWFKVT